MRFKLDTSSLAIAICSTGALWTPTPAFAQTAYVVPAGTTDTTPKTVAGTDSITVEQGGTLTTPSDPTIDWNGSSTGLVITNSGTINSTSVNGRAINASGGNNVRSVTLTNNANGMIESVNDAFRIGVNPSGGTILIENRGLIRSTGGGQALDFEAVATDGVTITINNYAGGVLRSFGQGAIRGPAAGAVTLTNAGTISGEGAEGVLFLGTSDDVITNSGLIAGGSGVAVDMGGGNDTLHLTTSGMFAGAVLGGAGTDRLDLGGAGSATLQNVFSGFEALSVSSGSWTANAPQSYSAGITIASGAALIGDGSATILGNGTPSVVNSGTLQNTGGLGRVIDISGPPANLAVDIQNSATGFMRGENATGAVIHLGFDPTGGSMFIVNDGRMLAGQGTTVDLSAASSGAAAITLDNRTGGTIVSLGDNVIRAAQGMTIRNGGEISTSSPFNVDAIFWGGYSGTVVNTGLVQGQRNGIYSTNRVDVTNDGTILARNGAAIEVGGSSVIVNRDTINGRAAFSPGSADSDGISITGFGIVSNMGRISGGQATGVDVNGRPNAGQGIEMGGGEIENTSFATITGDAEGILINSAANPGYAALGATTLTNFGLIGGSRAAGVRFVGNFDDVITSSGRIVGGAPASGQARFAIDMGGGNDWLNINFVPGLFGPGTVGDLKPGVDGIVDGGGGSDRISLSSSLLGINQLQLVNFESLAASSGYWQLQQPAFLPAGPQSFADSVLVSGTATLDSFLPISSAAFQVDAGALLSGRAGATISRTSGLLTVVNSGTINSIASGNRVIEVTGSSGPAISITNNAGGLILGTGQGLVSSLGATPGSTTGIVLVNNGTVRGLAGEGVLLNGDFDDTVTTSGFIVGGNGVAMDMGGGTDTLNLQDGAIFGGSVNGGAGSDRINLYALSEARLDNMFAAFELLSVNAGFWTLSGNRPYADAIAIASGTSLTGDAATLTGNIDVSGAAIFFQSSDASFVGAISGTGFVTKEGLGTLTIGSQRGFTGSTIVNRGRLNLNGELPGLVAVNPGGTLGGNGSAGSLLVNPGGTISPGSSIGTFTVTGDMLMRSDGIYAAELNPNGSSDRITVNGSALIDTGTLALSAQPGTYTAGTRFTLLTAAGGLTGGFTTLTTSNPNAAIEFRYGQTAMSVFVDAVRTGPSFAGVATTPNQKAVAGAFGALHPLNRAYAALVVVPDDAAVRTALDLLSGEIHASLGTAMFEDAMAADRAVLARIEDGSDDASARGLWIQGLLGRSVDKSRDGSARATRDVGGVIGGGDFALSEAVRLGFAGGYSEDTTHVVARLSRGKLGAAHVMGYAAADLGRLRVRWGVGFAFGGIDTTRSLIFPGFSAALRGAYQARTLNGFAEAGYVVPTGGGEVEPYLGLAGYRVSSDAFSESGDPIALRAAAQAQTFAIARAGLKAKLPIAATLFVRANAEVDHVASGSRFEIPLGFAAGGPNFRIGGARLSRDSAGASLGLVWAPGDALRLSVRYDGTFGANGSSNSGRATLSIGF